LALSLDPRRPPLRSSGSYSQEAAAPSLSAPLLSADDRVPGSSRRSRGGSEDECKRKTDFRLGKHDRILLCCRDLRSRISEPFDANLRAPNGRAISDHVCRGDCDTTNLIPGSQHLHLNAPSNGFYGDRGNKIPRRSIQCSWGVKPAPLHHHFVRRDQIPYDAWAKADSRPFAIIGPNPHSPGPAVIRLTDNVAEVDNPRVPPAGRRQVARAFRSIVEPLSILTVAHKSLNGERNNSSR